MPESQSTSAATASAWRDVRDGPPPPEYYQFARTVVQSAYEHLVPPLKAIDVLMLSAMGLAARFFYPAVKCSGPPDDYEYGVMDVRAVHSILGADPSWADRAGLIWTPGHELQREVVAGAFSTWLRDSLQPALGGPWCTSPDKSERGRTIKHQWQLIHRGYFKPNYAKMARDLEDIVVDNVGGNEKDPRRREKLPSEVKLAWVNLLGESGAFDTGAFTFASGALALDQEAAGKSLASRVGKGTPLKGGTRSLDHEETGGHGLLDVLEDDRAAQPEDAVAVQELRDFRDLQDLAALHPLLDHLAEVAEGDPTRARDLTDLFGRLVPVLDSLDDPALRAATVYQLGLSHGKGKGLWSRAEVGKAYGVTGRQIEKRSVPAAEILAGVRAA